MTGPLLEGLPPIVGDDARLLILGNMPSVMSLAARQYYANPRNGFWRIAGEIFGFDTAAAYDDRVASLHDCGVAVWDVLRHCRRQGSLDSAVERNSMVANDFEAFFEAHPAIDRVFFNGAAAEKNYGRLVTLDRGMRHRRLPSTSPAQTMRYENKLAAWRAALAPHARTKTDSAHRGDQETGGRRCAHGRAFSICAPSDSRVDSSNGLPTI
jgi:hypoxanthine-DNA glycosylase